MLACLLAGSVNAQEKTTDYLLDDIDIRDLPNPGDEPPKPGKEHEDVIHLYKDKQGDRYALQVDFNEKSGSYELYKHYITHEDDIYLEELGVKLKYLPDLNLEYPEPVPVPDIQKTKKTGSIAMRATSFTCPSATTTASSITIQYNHVTGVIFGNIGICRTNTGGPLKTHLIRYDVKTTDYDGQAAHTPTVAHFKHNNGLAHGVGMYFGHANSMGIVPYPCTHGQTSTHNTRIEFWSYGWSTGTTLNGTCGTPWNDGTWYRVNLEARNINNYYQKSRYYVRRWQWTGSGWNIYTHTQPVEHYMTVPNFDPNVTGLLIASTGPMGAPIGPAKSWKIRIINLYTWWTN